jgi:hypothetical protein
MSTIKRLLMELEESEQDMVNRWRRENNLSEAVSSEEMAVAVYDHARSDEMDSTEGQEEHEA